MKDKCRRSKTIKSTEITVTKVNLDMTTGEGGGHDEEGPTAVWEGVGIVSSLDLVAVIIFLYFIKLNICY